MKSMDGAAVFKALADENRVDIVRFIARHPGVTASALLDRLDIAQSTLSHHMKVLLSAGIVVCKRKGKWTHYSINIETVDRIERLEARPHGQVPPRAPHGRGRRDRDHGHPHERAGHRGGGPRGGRGRGVGAPASAILSVKSYFPRF